MPLQAYFRINAENMGQFERTLIIVDEDAYVHYVEGCTAPIYTTDSLHSAVVEIIVKPRGRCRYTTIQNWSNNVYNLVTKRAVAYDDATMEWVDGNLGSKLTMKYPAIWLLGERAHGEVLSIAFAGKGQHQDAGGKCVHVAPKTTSVITSKSISKNGGRAGYRGLLEVAKGATGAKSKVVCDALILDEESRSDTYPYIRIDENERRHRPRGDGVEDRRGAALLPDEPRPLGGRGERDDRLRVRRADHEGASTGVRGRDEPADPAPDGRLGRLGRTMAIVEKLDFVGGAVARPRALDPLLHRDARPAPRRPRELRVLGRASTCFGIWEPEKMGMEFVPQQNAHSALHVERRREARAELEAKGVEFFGETFDTGVCHMAFFSDPDGNDLMLHHRYASYES